MPASRSLRLLWLALVPVLVTPLYGQVSCNRTCPPAPNECQRSAGRSIETNQCVYTNLDGATCDAGGAVGTCADGQCVPDGCGSFSAFAACDEPEGAVGEGACIGDSCVLADPDDPCVKVGVGRINCCTDAGCSVASGAYCNNPVPDGTSCDPTGLEPTGLSGQDGLCIDGTCVAQSGLCAGLSCPTIWEEQCTREYCNPQTGECQEWWLDSYTQCLSATFNAPGFCRQSECITLNDDTCNGEACVSGPCVIRSCTYPCAITGDKICTIEDYQTQSPSCLVRNRADGERCQGEPGTCFRGACAFGACEADEECNDSNPCTTNTCNPFGGLCDTDPLPDGTPCGQTPSGQVLARCDAGDCLPDLCVNRDCSDGNSCTDDVCTSPFGICSNPTKADGESCDGEPGQCLFGNCQPVIPRCQRDSDCDDFNSCTEDTCPAGFCDFDTLPNGAPCIGENGQCFFGSCQAVIGF